MNKNAFSLTEAMVAAVIFTMAVAGVFATVGQMQKPAVASKKKSVSASLAKDVLERLRQAVDANSWDAVGGLLKPGDHDCSAVMTISSGVTCTYTVVDPGAGSPRQVTVNVNGGS